ncbi:hypothetical protein [Flindersiella endophytica]
MATRSTRGGTPTRTGPGAKSPSDVTEAINQEAGLAAPTRVSPDEVATIVEAPATPTTPMLLPPDLRDPDSLTESAVGTVTATYRSNQYIDALWSIDQTRNAFVLVRGLGWRKIYNGRDGSFVALCALASQARQTQRPVTFREEADGMVYEIYLW